MMIDKTLFVIFGRNKVLNNSRYVEMFYTLKTNIPFDEIVEMNSEFTKLNSRDGFGPFDTEVDLVNFSMGLCEKLKLQGICLCNEELLNTTFQEVKNINLLNQYLFENGDAQELPEQKKKGLFSNLF